MDEATREFYNGLGCAESEVPTIFCGARADDRSKPKNKAAASAAAQLKLKLETVSYVFCEMYALIICTSPSFSTTACASKSRNEITPRNCFPWHTGR